MTRTKNEGATSSASGSTVAPALGFLGVLRLAVWGVLCALGFSLCGVVGFVVVVVVLAGLEVALWLLQTAVLSLVAVFGWGPKVERPRPVEAAASVAPAVRKRPDPPLGRSHI